ncbi:MAG: NAD(P)-dependent oxidoreductase [SAR202 cluster bacterium]|nr:NAD(P)-dependent oxidoreductase [SAR202 cluster bacterium]|tara:strand:- start:946 stop:1857 length:912 start_codon:yes stop_codon:yes gene_type:complete
MSNPIKRILITGATGYIADQMLPTFKEKYATVLIDTRKENRRGEPVSDVNIVDLIDPDISAYKDLFTNVDAVIHLAYKSRDGDPIDHFYDEKENVEMAYNVFRAAYESGVPRVVMASSNHAADWYEHALIHHQNLDLIEPLDLPLSDNFYGWAKASYEHLGFLFAAGGLGTGVDGAGPGNLVEGNLGSGRKMGVVMVRIGAPRHLDKNLYGDNQVAFKRDLGAYISPRDITQLFTKAMETEPIENEHGIPWQVVYGISNNTRAFWSLKSAREVLGYQPEDDSEIVFANEIRELGLNEGKLGPL